jgi:hypothetical protein
MSDNAQEFRSATFAQAISQLGARHSFIRAGRPQTNGRVKRVQQSSWTSAGSRPSPATSSPSRPACASISSAISATTTTECTHAGRWTRSRTPDQVLGKAKLWHKTR